MKVFEVSSGKFIRSFEGHTHHVLNVAWIAHGRTLASGGADSAIKIWDFASGEQKKTITGVSREITALQFLDSRAEALAASGDNQLRLLRKPRPSHPTANSSSPAAAIPNSASGTPKKATSSKPSLLPRAANEQLPNNSDSAIFLASTLL
jgi:WD40 repeat protein